MVPSNSPPRGFQNRPGCHMLLGRTKPNMSPWPKPLSEFLIFANPGTLGTHSVCAWALRAFGILKSLPPGPPNVLPSVPSTSYGPLVWALSSKSIIVPPYTQNRGAYFRALYDGLYWTAELVSLKRQSLQAP